MICLSYCFDFRGDLKKYNNRWSWDIRYQDKNLTESTLVNAFCIDEESEAQYNLTQQVLASVYSAVQAVAASTSMYI